METKISKSKVKDAGITMIALVVTIMVEQEEFWDIVMVMER